MPPYFFLNRPFLQRAGMRRRRASLFLVVRDLRLRFGVVSRIRFSFDVMLMVRSLSERSLTEGDENSITRRAGCENLWRVPVHGNILAGRKRRCIARVHKRWPLRDRTRMRVDIRTVDRLNEADHARLQPKVGTLHNLVRHREDELEGDANGLARRGDD
jgi:hypothetical protein